MEGLVGSQPAVPHTDLHPHPSPAWSASAGEASIEMEGGTTFHFIDASPAEALKTAFACLHAFFPKHFSPDGALRRT